MQDDTTPYHVIGAVLLLVTIMCFCIDITAGVASAVWSGYVIWGMIRHWNRYHS